MGGGIGNFFSIVRLTIKILIIQVVKEAKWFVHASVIIFLHCTYSDACKIELKKTRIDLCCAYFPANEIKTQKKQNASFSTGQHKLIVPIYFLTMNITIAPRYIKLEQLSCPKLRLSGHKMKFARYFFFRLNQGWLNWYWIWDGTLVECLLPFLNILKSWIR